MAAKCCGSGGNCAPNLLNCARTSRPVSLTPERSASALVGMRTEDTPLIRPCRLARDVHVARRSSVRIPTSTSADSVSAEGPAAPPGRGRQRQPDSARSRPRDTAVANSPTSRLNAFVGAERHAHTHCVAPTESVAAKAKSRTRCAARPLPESSGRLSRAMDGARKPTGTYLRRVSRNFLAAGARAPPS